MSTQAELAKIARNRASWDLRHGLLALRQGGLSVPEIAAQRGYDTRTVYELTNRARYDVKVGRTRP